MRRILDPPEPAPHALPPARGRRLSGYWRIAGLGVAGPLLGSLACTGVSDWRGEWPTLHSAVEAIGGFASLTVAAVLVARVRLRGPRHPDMWMAAALAGMGTLDVFHAMVAPGPAFVWLHGLAVLVGGCLFAGVWAPAA